MWNRKKFHGNTDKLNMFLEAVEDDDELDEALVDPYQHILDAVEKGLSPDEVWESCKSESPGVLFAAADRLIKAGKVTPAQLGMKDEETQTVSDAAEDTNKKVQDLESEGNDESDVTNDEDVETVGESFEIGDNPEDKEQMKEAQFSRKDYNVVVDIITNSADAIVDELGVKGKESAIKSILAKEFADVFQADNPRFDTDRFINAVGE